MRINYTNVDGTTYELKGRPLTSTVEELLEFEDEQHATADKVVVYRAGKAAETYAPRPPDPKRYAVEYRTPRYGERYFEWLGGGTRMVDQRIDVNYGPLIGKRAVIVEEL